MSTVTWVFLVTLALGIIAVSMIVWHFRRQSDMYRAAYLAKKEEAAYWEHQYIHQTERLKRRVITHSQADDAHEFDRVLLEATRDEARKQSLTEQILRALPADPKQTSLEGQWQ